MTARPRIWSLNRIANQITALLALAGLLAFAVAGFFFVLVLPRPGPPSTVPDNIARIATVLRGLEAVRGAARRDLAAAYLGDGFTVQLGQSVRSDYARPAPEPVWQALGRDLPPGTRIVAADSAGAGHFGVSVVLSDGQPVTFDIVIDELPLLPLSLVPPLLFLVTATILLSVWIARRFVAPLARFATAVDRFDLESNASPLREEGPIEIRQATSAFNRMRDRILRMTDDRTQTLIAISHDLRTPLTRLRLRFEEFPEGRQKRQFLAEIRLMDSSIASAVSYLREAASREEMEITDLPSLVGTICDQFSDAGHAVFYDGPVRLVAHCRPAALARAISNLVDNATKFGSTVTVRLGEMGPDQVVIEVEDDGPGISDAEKPRVMAPFYRSNVARQEKGGFGLGLAIALGVAQGHGGALTLHDREPNGLRARLSLPVLAAERARHDP